MRLVNVGMWFERYNIILSSLVEDFLPGSWGHYEPSLIEILITIGSLDGSLLGFLFFADFFRLFHVGVKIDYAKTHT